MPLVPAFPRPCSPRPARTSTAESPPSPRELRESPARELGGAARDCLGQGPLRDAARASPKEGCVRPPFSLTRGRTSPIAIASAEAQLGKEKA